MNKVESITCIYHGQCMDGFGAAAILKNFYEVQGTEHNIMYHPAKYGEQIPEIAFQCDLVYILDFSYPAEEIVRLAHSSLRPRIIVLDHHKSAMKDLAHLEPVLRQYNEESTVIFDMEKSGTGLTWDWCYPDTFRNPIIQAIEDRDLWKETKPDWAETRAINSVLFSHPFDLNGTLYDLVTWKPTDIHILVSEGQAIDRKHIKDCKELVEHGTRIVDFVLPNGPIYRGIPVLNVPKMHASDCGNILAQNHPFAVTYSDVGKHREYSLRSNGGVDVSVICKAFGGGGHAKAAGFKIPLDVVKLAQHSPLPIFLDKD